MLNSKKSTMESIKTTEATSKNPNDLFTRSEVEEIFSNMLSTTKTTRKVGTLLNYEVVPVYGAGSLGEYFHLHLKYQIKESNVIKTTSLFVKSLPIQNPKLTEIMNNCGMLIKEAALYERLLNELGKLSASIWCARCYYTRPDLFVLQNIVDLGYEPLKNPQEFLTKTQMQMLLKTLATMHACSITYEERNQVNIGAELKDVLHELTVSRKINFYTIGVKAVLAVTRTHPAYQSEAHQKFIEEVLPHHFDPVYDMVNPSTQYRNVFCQRDVWGGNFFYHKSRPDQQPVVLVDYQLARYSPPAIDLLMAVYLNITTTQRRTMKHWCYDTYYRYFVDELERQGLEAEGLLSRCEFDDSLKAFELFGALYNCVMTMILRVPDNYLENLKLNDIDAFNRYMHVDRAPQVLELLRVNEKYRASMFECVEEMLQLLL